MNESLSLEIYFNPDATTDVVLSGELDLLESILPEIIRVMIQAGELSDAE